MSKLTQLFHSIFGSHVVTAPKPIIPTAPKPTVPTKPHRDYGDIVFPIVVPAWKVAWIPDLVRGHGLWDVIPKALRAKIETADDANSDLTILSTDLDAIDDVTWEKIKSSLA